MRYHYHCLEFDIEYSINCTRICSVHNHLGSWTFCAFLIKFINVHSSRQHSSAIDHPVYNVLLLERRRKGAEAN